MERHAILYLAVGFLLGAVLIWILQPDAGGEAAQETLIDGKYITFSNDYGNWIYERQADGTFKPVVKEMTARGLRTIWELQAEFQPRSIQTEGARSFISRGRPTARRPDRSALTTSSSASRTASSSRSRSSPLPHPAASPDHSQGAHSGRPRSPSSASLVLDDSLLSRQRPSTPHE